MRIVGGTHSGVKLYPPKSDKTRPTSDRVREALFNRLSHAIEGFELEGARVLDLFAGTGALGLEALSRGASFALFVEDAFEPRGLIRANIEKLQMEGQTKMFRRDATHLGPLKRLAPFNLVFLDPPYEKRLGEKALRSAGEGRWLAKEALIILEESKRAEIGWPDYITPFDQREFGDTIIHFAAYDDETSAPE